MRIRKPAAGPWFVVSSDWHLDASTAGAPRMGDVLGNLDRVKQYAIKSSGFFFLGDLTDPDSVSTHESVAHGAIFARDLRDADVSSVWLTGNHDVVEDGSGASTLSPIKGALNGVAWGEGSSETAMVEIESRPSARLHLGIFWVYLPFVSRARSYDPEVVTRAFAESYEEACRRHAHRFPVVVMGHLSVAGAALGSETHDMPRGRDVVLPVRLLRELFGPRTIIMNGHYHGAQVTESGVIIPGSPERFTFGEIANRPSFIVLRPKAEKPEEQIERIELPTRPMVRVGARDRVWSFGAGAVEELRETVTPRTLVRVDPPADVSAAVLATVRDAVGPQAVVMPSVRPAADMADRVLPEVGASACRTAALDEALRVGGDELRHYVVELLG